MSEVKISLEDAFKQNMSDGSSCSESEPFALRCIDNSMEPEFPTGCIIIIDPSAAIRDGSYVFAKDNKDEYIFRQVKIENDDYYLVPLNNDYISFKLDKGLVQIEGIITQRAGKRRSEHKWYE
jgi:SOS-response transcriptional repressor LexA